MIKVSHVDTYNFHNAIRGMRNPLNSWGAIDSVYDIDEPGEIHLGDNDLALARRLYRAGTEHRKFLRQIFVSMDVTAPLYWISEMDTYKVGTVRNSCSFMHKGLANPFTINDFTVHEQRVYEILSPTKKKEFVLKYKYETDEYKNYVGENGRKYRVYRNGRVIAEEFEFIDSSGRRKYFDEKECVPTRSHSGYFELNIGGHNGKKWMLHRLVATLWLDNTHNFDTVNHIDGDKGNNCVENLEWCSLQDNIKKGFDNGLFENGKSLHAKYMKWKNGHVLFPPQLKNKILEERRMTGKTCRELADEYNVTIHQMNNLISRRENENEELFMLCFVWENTINTLNALREIYKKTHDDSVFHQIRCLLPCGYNQTYTLTMNYEVVANILRQRSNHKLQEWRDFCAELRKLPWVEEIMFETEDDDAN